MGTSVNAYQCTALARRASSAAKIVPTSGSNSVVESQPSKLLVAGSIPVSRSIVSVAYGHQEKPLLQNTP
jgi:hypothetical protein